MTFSKNFKKILTLNVNPKNKNDNTLLNENDEIQKKLLETILQDENEDNNLSNRIYEKNEKIEKNEKNSKNISSRTNKNNTNPTAINSRHNSSVNSNIINIKNGIGNSVKEFSNENQEKIIEIFRKLFIFDIFPDNLLETILNSLILLSISKGDFLYTKDSPNNFFYIVVKGEFETIFDEPEKNNIINYKEWDYFGIDTLMNKNKITIFDHSLLAKQNSDVLILDGENFLQIKQKVITIILEERYNFINNIIFLKNLDGTIKYNLAENLSLINFSKDEIIIKKGDKNNKSIYLIKKGSVKCCLNGENIKILNENKYFGMIALILKTERTLDVIAEEDCQCFELNEKLLIDIIGENYSQKLLFYLFKDVITNNISLYDFINEDNLPLLFEKFKINHYNKNEKINQNINKKNLTKKRIIIVIAGNFVKENSMDIIYSSGNLIGEETIKNHIDIKDDLIAFPDLISLEANLKDIESILGEEYKSQALNKKYLVKKLEKIPLFKGLNNNELNIIINYLKKERFTKGQIIIKENTTPENFYIILKGSVSISQKGKIIRQIEKGNYFGEKSIINNTERTMTVKTNSNCTCLTMNKENFFQFYKNEKIKKRINEKLLLEADNIQFENLYFIKFLGRGQFGNVSLVHNNKYLYAIKAILKKSVNLKKKLADYIIAERNILLILDHPFIGKIIKTFKNKAFVFLLLEYINGISLYNLLKNNTKIFSTEDTKFYIASLLLVIDYLHKKKILHRDIKPSNIMINHKGYIKLIDFGTSKIINDYTSTVIGTPHYMSPEILSGRGYSFSCDYWSVGIVSYEIFYKKFPFGNDAKDVMDIYHDIMYAPNFKYPFQNERYFYLNQLINYLLIKKVEKRFCNLNNIKKLEFFNNFEWDDLINCNVKTPFIPNARDLQNYNFGTFKLKYNDYIGGDINNYIIENQNEESSWDKDF